MPTIKPRTRVKRTDDIKPVVGMKELIAQGVPRQAMFTNLPLQGQDELRRIVLAQEFSGQHKQTDWVYFYPKPSRDRARYLKNVEQCTLVFGLYHKECVMAGNFMMATYLAHLYVHAANTPYEAIDFLEILTACYPYIVLHDFMGRNEDLTRFGNVLSVFENFMMRTWYEDNIGLLTMGYVEPEKLQAGWSERMRAHIAGKYTRKYCIEAPE